MAPPSLAAAFGGASMTPLPLPSAQTGVKAYPEPAAVRAHQQTAQSAMQRVPATVRPTMQLDTTESRAAIPVPGPGAVMPAQASVGTAAPVAKKDPLAGLPVEVVGVNGNPYQTKVLVPSQPAAGGAGSTQGLPASQLPLPDPNQMSLPAGVAKGNAGVDTASAGGVRDVGKFGSTRGAASRKGGSLLHNSESSGSPENATARREEGGGPRRVEDEAKGDASDRSFVF